MLRQHLPPPGVLLPVLLLFCSPLNPPLLNTDSCDRRTMQLCSTYSSATESSSRAVIKTRILTLGDAVSTLGDAVSITAHPTNSQSHPMTRLQTSDHSYLHRFEEIISIVHLYLSQRCSFCKRRNFNENSQPDLNDSRFIRTVHS